MGSHEEAPTSTENRGQVRSRPSGLRVLAASTYLLIVALVLFGFATYWTFEPFGSEDRSVAYDSLAEHLRRGSAEVDESAINWEGLRVGNRTYMYFGAFPALPRMVLNQFLPERAGQWGRLSTFTAVVLAWLALMALFAEGIGRRQLAQGVGGPVLLGLLGLGLAFGTPILLLASCGHIYHEAIAWGLAGAACGLFFAARLARVPESSAKANWIGLSCSAGVALLSRPTFGGPIYLALAALVLLEIIHPGPDRPAATGRRLAPTRRALVLLCLIPAMATLAFQLWYNHARFGSLITFIDYQYYYLDPGKFGGELNPARVPSTVANYFLPRRANFIADAPWVVMAESRYHDDRLFWEWKEPTLGLLAASPWLIGLAALGLLGRGLRAASAMERVILGCLATQAALVLSFYWTTQRYATELLPLLAFATYLAVRSLAPSPRPATWRPLVLTTTVALSVAVTAGSTLHWLMAHDAAAPPPYRAAIRRLLSPRPTLPVWAGSRIWLDQLTPSGERFTHIPHRDGTCASGDPLVASGWPFAHGVGLHAVARLEYDVPAGADAFEAILALADHVRQEKDPSVIVRLRDETGRPIFTSRRLVPGDPIEAVRVPLDGTTRLVVEVEDAGDGISYDHLNLLEAAFLLRP